jgi:osmotically-inducible protein OsmY
MVDDALIEVDVKDDKVILSGSVGSLQEKNRARMDAWVAAVDSVDSSGLEIKWWARDEMRRTHKYASRSNDQIEDAVKSAFIYDPRVEMFDVDVDASYGTVTLSGVVDNFLAKRAAEDDARNTVGVTRVINNLKVQPKIIPDNEELERRVGLAFVANPYIERFELTISAYNGRVYISGNVNTSWEKNLTARVAEGVKGVVDVVNNVDYEHQWSWKPDREIREDVKDQLWWSPFVDENQVFVSVENGLVELNGTVDSYSERRSAEDNAYEGGAKDVTNNLEVSTDGYSPYYYGPYSPHTYGL